VAALEQEAASLEQRCAEREREVRAPVVEEHARRSGLQAAVEDEEARLAAFIAELNEARRKPVLTVPRALFASASLGAFCWGAMASGFDVTRMGVGLFAGVWVAFLIGALRGR
jgi:hypothetical protein